MKRIRVEKIICFILIGIIVLEGIYIYFGFNENDIPYNACTSAYACKCGENNEQEMCDCKYQTEEKGQIVEKDIQCHNPNLEGIYE